MSFDLTDEQRSFRDVLRGFVDERVAPNAARYDREQVYPQDSFDACVDMELPSLGVPEAYGGAGADMVTQAIMIEEIARGCASTAVTVLISKLGMLPVINFGSEELKLKYLPRVASGEIQASYCLSEADAGSDVASMHCRAERDGDDYVLNGSKYWITNAGSLIPTPSSLRLTPVPGGEASRASWWKKSGGLSFPSTKTRWDCAHRPLGRSSCVTCEYQRRTASAKKARGSRSPCTRSIVRARPLGPRPSASPRAPSTTPGCT